jgi:hypothetical protein
MLASSPIVAEIYGSEGWVTTDPVYVCPTGLKFSQVEGPTLTWQDESGIKDRDGLCYEATVAAKCIATGLLEPPQYTLDQTLATLGLIDQIRTQLLAQGRSWTPPEAGTK